MDVFIRITRPACPLMNGSAALVLRLFRAPLRGEGAVHSPEELKLIATATRRMGLLATSFQEEIIHRAIELNHVTVREIMTPRGKIFSLPADMPIERASARIIDEQHSRVPVYDARRQRQLHLHCTRHPADHIIGVVYSKDISRLMHFRAVALGLGGAANSSDLTLRQVMREVFLVPETKLAVDLLQEFQDPPPADRRRRRRVRLHRRHRHRRRRPRTGRRRAGRRVRHRRPHLHPQLLRRHVLDGSTTLRDLGTQLRWTFPREAGVETLAGFLLAQLGHHPTVGESIVFEGRRFTVAEMAGRRISPRPRRRPSPHRPSNGDRASEADERTLDAPP